MGQTLLWYVEQVQTMIQSGPDSLADERKALGQALDDVQGHLGVHSQQALAAMQDEQQRDELYKVGLHSVALLNSVSELIIGWMLLRQAEVAQTALDAGSTNGDTGFYTGKLAIAAYWAKAVLPKARQRRELAAAEDGALMELPESAF